jgi:DNA-binding NtrC family response regulator
MARILIVDDEAGLRQSFARLLVQEGHEVTGAASGEEALARVAESLPDLAVMDVRMPGASGLETLARLRVLAPGLPVIIMTAYGTTATAIEAVNTGAFDYILKPFEVPRMLRLIDQALAAGRAGAAAPRDEKPSPVPGAMLGQSQAMQEVYKMIGRVAGTSATVLIRGESGTGKELAAKAIHAYSRRAAKPFLVINCVAIPETLLESELFGYEKGAFTGAGARRAGRIELAAGGTIFLDEIGDMPLSLQAKILRLLEEKTVERLGGGKALPVDARILAATNRDLEAAIAAGNFREDLFYRLKVVTITLPPLRERAGDIALLAEHFLTRHARELGVPSPGLLDSALRSLAEYAWPGNVRELANVMQKALIFGRGVPIGADQIVKAVSGGGASGHGGASEDAVREFVRQALLAEDTAGVFHRLTDRFDGLVVAEALTITGGNRSRAAKLLGISRPNLLAKMDKLGLCVQQSVKLDGK